MELLKGLDGLDFNSQKYLNWETLRKLIAHYGDVLNVNEMSLKAELAKYHILANSGTGIVTMDPAFYPNLMNSSKENLACIICRSTTHDYQTSAS